MRVGTVPVCRSSHQGVAGKGGADPQVPEFKFIPVQPRSATEVPYVKSLLLYDNGSLSSRTTGNLFATEV